MINSKSSLAIALSRLKTFASPRPRLEQYPTDSEIAAEVLWHAYMLGDIDEKTIADLGCGTGVLGIGALLLGAKKVFFIDTDDEALAVLQQNLEQAGLIGTPGSKSRRSSGNTGTHEIINSDISLFDREVDVVLQNPPFGTRETHIDREFLKKAVSVAQVIYSFHKTSTRRFVESFAEDNGVSISASWDFSFPLKQTMPQHKRRIHRIDVTCFRMEKSRSA
jgi:putative methylase